MAVQHDVKGEKMKYKFYHPVLLLDKLRMTDFSEKPCRPLFLIAATIFIAEYFVMMIMKGMPSIPNYLAAFIDSLLLTLIVFPVLLHFVVKPLTSHIAKRRLDGKKKNDLIVKLDESLAKEKEIHERFRSLFDMATDSIVLIDPQTKRIVDCNVTAYEKLGYSKEALLSLSIYDICIESRTDAIKDNFNAQLSGEKTSAETVFIKKSGATFPVEVTSNMIEIGNTKIIQSFARDISVRRSMEEEKERIMIDLKTALSEIRTLRGILPLCSFCKKIRNDEGYWEQVDVYIDKHSMADISHGVCPDCLEKHYPDYAEKLKPYRDTA